MSGAGPGPGARAAAATLSAYKRYVSPLLPPACRFHPTCSEYAREAILRHAIVVASRVGLSGLTIGRLAQELVPDRAEVAVFAVELEAVRLEARQELSRAIGGSIVHDMDAAAG